MDVNHVPGCVFTTFVLTLSAPVSMVEVVYDDEYDDPQPLNCSTTESIKGGHVTYSQVKTVFKSDSVT